MKNTLIILLFFMSIVIYAQKDSIYIKETLDKAYNYEKKKPDSALFLYDKMIQFSNKKGFPIFEAKATNYKGIVFSDMGKYDSAVSYYNKSITIFKGINNQKGIATNLINIGNTFQFKGDLQNATNYYLEGIKIYEKLKDNYRLGISYGNLATIFKDISQIDDAKKSLFKSNIFALKVNDSVQLVNNYYNLTDMYLNENKIDSAFVTIKDAKRYLANSSNNHLKYLISYGETRYNIKMGNHTKALTTSQKTLNYALQNKNPYYLALTHSLLGKMYFKQKQYKMALTETHKGLSIAKKHHNKASLIKMNSQLFSIYNEMDNLKKALFHKDLQYKYKDTVLNEAQKKNINLLQTQFKTAKKDKKILQQKIKLQQQQTQNNYMKGIALFLFIGSILTWFLFQQRQKRKDQEIVTLKREHQIKTLETLIKGEEKERLRMAKELHDGVNGDLAAIKFKLSTLLEMNNSVIKEAIEMIDNSCSQVRAISHNLVPPSLENFNLVEAVEEYCIKTNELHTENITFQHLGNEVVKLSKKEEINSYRIIQELVSNSLKHAKASEINVQISCRNNIINITVEDNGIGFEKEQVKNKGIGLSNIQSRMDYLHANVDFLSNKKGTSYIIEIDKN